MRPTRPVLTGTAQSYKIGSQDNVCTQPYKIDSQDNIYTKPYKIGS